MKTRLLPLFLAGVALLFAAGCQSVESRIKEKPAAFANADKAAQDKIKQGIIDLGFSQDLVYIALGEPDQKREAKTTAGSTLTWIYNTYYTRYEGSTMAGYYRRVYYDPYLRTYRLYYHPVFADTYSEDKEERIRIVFTDGKVTSIEQAKE